MITEQQLLGTLAPTCHNMLRKQEIAEITAEQKSNTEKDRRCPIEAGKFWYTEMPANSATTLHRHIKNIKRIKQTHQNTVKQINICLQAS